MIQWINQDVNKIGALVNSRGLFPLFKLPVSLFATSFGPAEPLSNSGPPYDSNKYIAYIDEIGNVLMEKEINGVWDGDPINLLTLPFFADVQHLGFGFDRLGRITLAYELINGTIGLWWFDPQVNNPQLVENLAIGNRPLVDLEDKRLGGTQDPETFIFYTRNNAIYYRAYSDRYEVEYDTPVTDLQGAQIREVGMNSRLCYQVNYR